MSNWDKFRQFLAVESARWWRDLSVVGVFLTRLPFAAGKDAAKKGALASAAGAFPLVGVVVGAGAGGSLMAASFIGLHPLACAFIAIAASALITGALHEDGLADVADGFGGGRTKTEKLKIMRDSRIGTFGVLAVIFSVGIRAGTLGGLPGPETAAAALIAAAALSRGLLPATMHVMAPARKSGLAFKAGIPEDEAWVTALVVGALAGFLFLGPWGGLGALVVGVLAAGAVAWLGLKQIGGTTGDLLGAQQQAVETAVLIAAAAAL